MNLLNLDSVSLYAVKKVNENNHVFVCVCVCVFIVQHKNKSQNF